MADFRYMNEQFELFFRQAKEDYRRGELALAKRNFMLAAEQLLKMAKESVGETQKKYYSRAKELIALADSITPPAKEQGGVPAPAEPQKPEKDASSAPPKRTEPQKPAAPGKDLPPDRPSVEEALYHLNALIGLNTAKAQLNEWVKQVRAIISRCKRGYGSMQQFNHHFVFVGNAGTGKMTVAHVVAQICYSLGIISKGHLVVCRQRILAASNGSPAEKMREVIKQATGGVLVIDDASTFAGRASDNPEEELIALVDEMKRRDDLVVIVMGSEAQLDRFFAINPALRRAFATFITFDDYTAPELFQIFTSLCRKAQFTIAPDALMELKRYFEEKRRGQEEACGNSNEVFKLFDEVAARQGKRTAKLADPSDAQLAEITVEDLPFARGGAGTTEAGRSGTANSGGRTPAGSDPSNAKPHAPAQPEDKVMDENVTTDPEFQFNWDNLPSITFDDIAGLENVKDVVRVKVLLPLQHPEVFEGYVRKSGGGLLLYGPPGTGKTMIAAAIANEIGAKFCSVKPSDLLHQGAGNTEKAVRALFAQARRFPCAVIYFDEMDSISPKTTKSQYAKQMRSELLAQLQGIEEYGEEKDNILFLIAATNKPWEIDSAFVRPGRFGTRIYVGLPDVPARKYMITHRLDKIRGKGVVKVGNVDVDKVVEATNGFNGADMSNLFDRVEELSALRGLKSGVKMILQEDFEKALEQISSSVQSADIQKLLEWKKAND